MSRRGLVLLVLGVAASLHCSEVMGQSATEPTLEAPGAMEIGGEQPVPVGMPAVRCLDALAATGATFRPLGPLDEEEVPLPGCGMTEAVVLARGPTGIAYRPALRVSCAFALALPELERTIQAVANDTLGEPIEVARIMGSYGCRTIQSTRSPGRLSEHAVGNAIDVGELWTRSRRAIVLRDFRRDDPAGMFLRAVAARLREVGPVERVLDPDTNQAHHNHFHLEGRPLR
jgi:hypothetical protein